MTNEKMFQKLMKIKKPDLVTLVIILLELNEFKQNLQ